MDDTTKKQIFFVFIILFILLGIYFLIDLIFSVSNMVKVIFLIVLAFILVTVIIFKTGFVLFLQQYERAVISRFGRLHRVSGPGWAFMIPWVETFKLVDLRTQTLDVPKQDVITKDNVSIKIDAVIYLFVRKDPRSIINSVMEIDDYKQASQQFIKSTVREVIGGMELSEVISNINELNRKMVSELAHISANWGISVESVELKEIIIPDTVVEAMHKQKAATQERLAIVQLAEAEREKIDAINKAASNLTDKSVTYYYIKALEEMSKGASSKIIFPMEFTRLAEVLAGKVMPKAGEKSKLEGFIDKYGDLLEDKLKGMEDAKKEPL
jgi:regulator of protease activity HflC (stomatin/prohibitin superfamily)